MVELRRLLKIELLRGSLHFDLHLFHYLPGGAFEKFISFVHPAAIVLLGDFPDAGAEQFFIT